MVLSNHYLTKNDCYKDGRKIVPRGVMVHSTGVAQPDPDVFVRAWNKPGVEVAVHAIVSQKGVYQCLPWDCRGWHAGGAANNTHIGFEICEDGLDDPDYFAAVYQEAVELTACLCKKFGLDPLADGVVICHQEGYQRGVASNHADVLHWFPKFGKSMDDFRADTARAMRGDDSLTQEQFNAMMDAWLAGLAGRGPNSWSQAARSWAEARGIISGDGSGALQYQKFCTREELIQILYALQRAQQNSK